MSLKQMFSRWLACALLSTLSATALATEITLHLASGNTGNHKYFHRLLEESLKATGHNVTIVPESDLPQPRMLAYLDSGKLTAHWMLQTPERDVQFVRVNHPLTQGLIGQRVLLIPKGSEGRFSNVHDLAQLKALNAVAGLGKDWFDVSVWRDNELPYQEVAGDWRKMFVMTAAKTRGIDYMPRGVTEIVAEAASYPDLTIEPNLLLVYQRDFAFYLGKSNAEIKPLIEAALQKAEKSGLQKRLIDEYFGPSQQHLNIDKRIRIKLRTPI